MQREKHAPDCIWCVRRNQSSGRTTCFGQNPSMHISDLKFLSLSCAFIKSHWFFCSLSSCIFCIPCLVQAFRRLVNLLKSFYPSFHLCIGCVFRGYARSHRSRISREYKKWQSFHRFSNRGVTTLDFWLCNCACTQAIAACCGIGRYSWRGLLYARFPCF